MKWVREQAEVRFDNDGRAVSALGIVQDISEIKQAEQATQKALTEAQRLAKVRSEFVANMSHEIRTPLNAVLGLARMGGRGNSLEKAREIFTQITDSGQHLLQVVNDILDFSKIEAGKLSDVVLMDIQMPVMDGYTATRRMQKIAPNLPVIGLTAHALAEEKQHCLTSGMLDHVAKPIEVDVLVAAIRRQLPAEGQALNPLNKLEWLLLMMHRLASRCCLTRMPWLIGPPYTNVSGGVTPSSTRCL